VVAKPWSELTLAELYSFLKLRTDVFFLEQKVDDEELDKLLNRLATSGELSRVKAVYCQSYFQNPTGLTLALERRSRLVEIGRSHSVDHRIVIVEDAAYRELRYDGDDLPSVKRYDADNAFVASCYTFDKPFAAGLKVGYAILPPALALRYQRIGAYGFGVLFLVLMFARPIIGYWMLPSALLARSLSGAVSSFIIASPWTS
jgi:hypothetical protein